jgi:hypothetical protein
LELLESRYNLGEAVLFHRTKCSAAAMLERAIYAIYGSFKEKDAKQWIGQLPERLLDCSDDQMLAMFYKEAVERDCKTAIVLLHGLRHRTLHKSFCSITRPVFTETASMTSQTVSEATFDLVTSVYLGLDVQMASQRSITENKEDLFLKRQKAASTRFDALTLLEQDLALPEGSLVMYCPPLAMNSKIAEVKIEVHGSIKSLEKWDRDRRLAGGHCQAQLARFERLWRAEVFISKLALESIQKHGTKLQNAFEKAALFLLFAVGDDGGSDDNTLHIAEELSGIPGSPFHERKAELTLADRGGKRNRYPMGGISLRSCFNVRRE